MMENTGMSTELVFDSAIDSALDPVNVLVASTLVFYPNDHAKEYWFNSQGNAVREAETIISDVSGLLEDIVTTYRYNEDAILIEKVLPYGSSVKYRYQREEYMDLHNGDSSADFRPSDLHLEICSRKLRFLNLAWMQRDV